MKQVIQHIQVLLILIFSGIILFTTSGFNIYLHTCTTTNTNNVSLLVPAEKCEHANSDQYDSCCNTRQKEKSETKKCCNDKHEYKKLKIDTVLTNTAIDSKALNTLIIETLYANTFLAYYNQNINSIPIIKGSPPPIENSEYRSLIQVYLI